MAEGKTATRNMEIAQRIRSAREKKRLSQTDFADRLGVRTHTANRWEMQGMVPKPEMLAKIADLLDVQVGWLLRGSSTLVSTDASDLMIVRDHGPPAYGSTAEAGFYQYVTTTMSPATEAFALLDDSTRLAVTKKVLAASPRAGADADWERILGSAILTLTGRLIASTGPSLVKPAVDGERRLPPRRKK